MFWPGSTAPLGGVRPTEWKAYDAAFPADLDALALPDEEAWLEERRPFLLYRAR